MKYDFDEVIDRRKSSYSMKWENTESKRRRFDMDINDETISFYTADMDFRCAQPIITALHNVADHGIFGYSSLETAPEYYQAVIDWFGRHYGWKIEREHMVYISGTVEALKQMVLAFTDEGDGVIIQRPVYGPFGGVIHSANRKLVDNRLIDNDGYYTMDYDDLERKAADPANKLLLLCSPHNPVGRVWTADELKRLAEICRRHNVIIAADEIHGDLNRVGVDFIPIATVADNGNIVTATAINKTFNLAGLNCTNMVIPNPELRQRFVQTAGEALPSPFTIAAAVAAYNECEDWLQQAREYIDGNIDWLLGFLADSMPKLRCRRPEGTYIVWLDFREYGLSPEQLHERIYRRANVMLERGTVFDPVGGQCFHRACLPSPRSLVKKGFERIAGQF